MGLLPLRANPVAQSIVGFSLFTVLAVVATIATRQTPYQTSVPLLFIIVAAVVAFFVGKTAAYAGLSASAVVFAYMLFAPIGSWHVNAQAGRVSLAWMLMGGLAATWIFARQNKNPNE